MKDYHYLYRPIMFKKNKGVLILNIIISLYLIYMMPQNIFSEENYFLPKLICVIVVYICSFSFIINSLKNILFSDKE